jgi:hypothetical protein
VVDEELLQTFWTFYRSLDDAERAASPEVQKLGWASEMVGATMRRGGSVATEMLVALADSAPDDDAVIYIGCGPMEDLMFEHGDDAVDVLEEAARRHPKLRHALAVAVPPREMSEESRARLQRYREERDSTQ